MPSRWEHRHRWTIALIRGRRGWLISAHCTSCGEPLTVPVPSHILAPRVGAPTTEEVTMPEPTPEETPNVVVSNPNVRRAANIVLGVIGLAVGTAVVVDGSTPAFDITAWTTPIIAGYAYLASAFGLAVTLPNIPKR